ncbi:putative PurR-regulated permease PerM [Streptohalobacillus salinus]|uniref:Putative PurR-regulated permease PerM n=1 Tax=Streptohalobacillus salinus TaxID=621096 RepID=A0A2V3WBN5_9BACI|nr:AI-2E family transporter [Streptohalobacillus salinus]PXW90946.1 putative PurR-regulated permease PerM [Streptohalobacillus salinus]
MLNKKPFRFLVYALMIFGLIYLLSLTDFVFQPIGTVLASVAVPIIGAGFLFYITNPFVNLLERLHIKRVYAVIIIFVVIILLIALSVYFIIPVAQAQLQQLYESAPEFQEWFQSMFALYQNNEAAIPDQVQSTVDSAIDSLSSYGDRIVTSVFSALSAVFSFLFSFVLIPFFLFFMLKDSGKFVPFITQFLSPRVKDSTERLLKSVDDSLGSFIQGQMLVSVSLGIMLFIGYLIVGINYALVLALLALVLNLIPYLGPWLSAIPAVLIGFFQDPMVGVWTAVVVIAVQQIEGNFVEPNIMGKVLHVHPLTVVVIMLAAGALIGFVGLIFAVPAYAVIKAVVMHFYQEYMNYLPEDEKYLV